MGTSPLGSHDSSRISSVMVRNGDLAATQPPTRGDYTAVDQRNKGVIELKQQMAELSSKYSKSKNQSRQAISSMDFNEVVDLQVQLRSDDI